MEGPPFYKEMISFKLKGMVHLYGAWLEAYKEIPPMDGSNGKKSLYERAIPWKEMKCSYERFLTNKNSHRFI